MFDIVLLPVSNLDIALNGYTVVTIPKPSFNIELRNSSSFNISLYTDIVVLPSNNILTISGKGIIMRIGRGTNPVIVQST